MTAVVSQRFRGKRLARPEPQAPFGRESRAGYVGIPLNRKVVNQCLRALGDLKSHVNFQLTIDNISVNFYVFVSQVFVERGNARHTLTEQLVTELPSGKQNETVRLHHDLPGQHVFTEMLVTSEIDGLHSVAGSPLDVVDQLDRRGLVLESRCYFHIEVALALKKIDQISPALFH